MKRSTCLVCHLLKMDNTNSRQIMVQVNTIAKVSKDSMEYSYFPLCTLRHDLCLNASLVVIYLLHLNAHKDGRTCYSFENFPLRISHQLFCSMREFTSLMMDV